MRQKTWNSAYTYSITRLLDGDYPRGAKATMDGDKSNLLFFEHSSGVLLRIAPTLTLFTKNIGKWWVRSIDFTFHLVLGLDTTDCHLCT